MARSVAIRSTGGKAQPDASGGTGISVSFYPARAKSSPSNADRLSRSPGGVRARGGSREGARGAYPRPRDASPLGDAFFGFGARFFRRAKRASRGTTRHDRDASSRRHETTRFSRERGYEGVEARGDATRGGESRRATGDATRLRVLSQQGKPPVVEFVVRLRLHRARTRPRAESAKERELASPGRSAKRNARGTLGWAGPASSDGASPMRSRPDDASRRAWSPSERARIERRAASSPGSAGDVREPRARAARQRSARESRSTLSVFPRRPGDLVLSRVRSGAPRGESTVCEPRLSKEPRTREG